MIDYSRIVRKHLNIKTRLCFIIFIPLLIYITLTSTYSIKNKSRLSEEKIKEMHIHVKSTLSAVSELALQIGNKTLIEKAANSAIKSTLISSICILDFNDAVYYSTISDAECGSSKNSIALYREAIDEGKASKQLEIEFDNYANKQEEKTQKVNIGSIKYSLDMTPFHQSLTDELMDELLMVFYIIIACIPLFLLFYHSIMKPTESITNTIKNHDSNQKTNDGRQNTEYADELEYAHVALIDSYKRVDTKTAQLEDNKLALEQRTFELEETASELVLKTSELEHQVTMTVKEKDKADKANASKSEFLSMVSHEVRGPISTVYGLLEVLSKSRLSSHDEKIVRLSFDAMDPLITLLDDLMQFSSMDHQSFSISKSHYDLVDEFQKSLSHFSKRELNNDIELSLSILNNAFFNRYLIETDRIRVRQVLHNLINNAYKFTSEGFIQIELNIDSDEKQLLFKVKDSGLGIDCNKQQLIFNKFEQLHDHVSTRKHDGIGIGLTICKRICNSMGGSIEVESELGEGSCFSVTLPISYELREKLKPSSDAQLTEEDYSLAKLNLRALLVEDNSIMNYTISCLLHEAGIKVDRVNSAAEALSFFRKNQYDVAVIDCYMPVTNGFDLTRSIREIESSNNFSCMPIIGVSASTNPNTEESAIESGMDSFMTKPYKAYQLYALIQDLVLTRKQIKSALSGEFTSQW